MKPNWALLGGVRFALAMIVVSLHSVLIFGQRPYLHAINGLNSFAAILAFFVVSGFSIRASIEREPKGFYLRRFNRIAPVYFACVFLSLTVLALAGGIINMPSVYAEFPPIQTILLVVFMLQHVFSNPFPLLNPSWTLWIECAFYLLAPLLLRLTPKVVAGLAVGSALCFVFGGGTAWPNMGGIVPALALGWAWLIGWLLYQYREHEMVRMAGVVAPIVIFSAWNTFYGRFFASTLAFATICLSYGHHLILSPRAAKVLCYLGEISYPLYLSHLLTGIAIKQFTGATAPEWMIGGGLLMSIVLYHCVDLPYRKYIVRRNRPQTGAPTTPSFPAVGDSLAAVVGGESDPSPEEISGPDDSVVAGPRSP